MDEAETTLYVESVYYGGSCRMPSRLTFGTQEIEVANDFSFVRIVSKGFSQRGERTFNLVPVEIREQTILRNMGGIVGSVALPARLEIYELQEADPNENKTEEEGEEEKGEPKIIGNIVFVYTRDQLDHVRLGTLEFRAKASP